MEPLIPRKYKLLIVDDNQNNIQVIGNILKEKDYQIGFAMNGQQALDTLKHSTDFDLVLLDVNMPVMNGYETIKAIREDPAIADIPVIFLTAHNDPESIIKGFTAGAQDYIIKPFLQEELVARVNTHLQLKHKTDQLKNVNLFLEQQVAIRTSELTEANAKLERLDKVKNDFLHIISHELNTPLHGIIGFSEILKPLLTDEKQTQFFNIIVSSALRLSKFISSLLIISELKLNRINLSLSKSELQKIIDKVIVLSSESILEKKIQIIKNYDLGSHTVLADIALIEIALKGIINNAVYYTNPGTEIKITTQVKGDFLLIAIEDKGPGFNEDVLKFLYDLFNVGDYSNRSEGKGLSLATAKLIMDIHKGRIEVKNKEIGAEVTLYLPVSKEID
jgi:two-component system, sensor histidine kinase and response regulator